MKKYIVCSIFIVLLLCGCSSPVVEDDLVAEDDSTVEEELEIVTDPFIMPEMKHEYVNDFVGIVSQNTIDTCVFFGYDVELGKGIRQTLVIIDSSKQFTAEDVTQEIIKAWGFEGIIIVVVIDTLEVVVYDTEGDLDETQASEAIKEHSLNPDDSETWDETICHLYYGIIDCYSSYGGGPMQNPNDNRTAQYDGSV